MKITWYGHACFRVQGVTDAAGEVALVTDPYTPEISGYDPILEAADIVVMSSADDPFHSYAEGVPGDPVVVNALELPPEGRTERGVRLASVPTSESLIHRVEPRDNAIYTFALEGLRLGHMGDVGNPLGQPELDLLRGVDVLFALAGGPPVIELPDLVEAIAAIRPRLVIPMHYRTPKVRLSRILDVEELLGLFPAEMVSRPDTTVITVTRDSLPREQAIVRLEYAC